MEIAEGNFRVNNSLLFYPKVALINPGHAYHPLPTLLRRCSGTTQDMIREVAKRGLDK